MGEGRPTRRRLSLAVGFVLLIGACSAGDDGVADDGASPLADFLGLDGDADLGPRNEAGLALAVLAETERQEAIAQCMAEEGFEYVPVVADSDTGTSAFDGTGSADRRWIERYGFGISTLWYWQDALPPDLVGYTVADLDEEDPNLAIVAGLSEAEEQAYGLALYGDGFLTEAVDETTIEPVPGGEPDDDPDLGCHGTAGPSELYEELSLDFGDELAEMESAIETDPRIAGAYDAIAICVRRTGREFTNPAAAIAGFDQAMTDFDAGLDQDRSGQGLTLSPEQEAELAEIQADEVALAVAVEDCGGSAVELQDTLRAVRHEYEADFVERNRDSLERFRDAHST